MKNIIESLDAKRLEPDVIIDPVTYKHTVPADADLPAGAGGAGIVPIAPPGGGIVPIVPAAPTGTRIKGNMQVKNNIRVGKATTKALGKLVQFTRETTSLPPRTISISSTITSYS